MSCNGNLTESKAKSTNDTIIYSKAIVAAENWLRLVDSAKYSEAYNRSGRLIKIVMEEDVFADELRDNVKRYGNIVSRIFTFYKHFNKLPGVPQGKYVVIQYISKYSKSTNLKLTEIVTVGLNEKKDLVVEGYYLLQYGWKSEK